MPTDTTARVVRRPQRATPRTVTADICVVGAGIAGTSAALEAARLGRRVVIVDAAPALGGQAIGSIIGTIIGLYTHGPEPYQITHGIADGLIADLTAEGSLNRRVSMTGTITFQYDEVRLARWIEQQVEAAGIQVLVGAVMTGVVFENRRLRAIELATRFGAARVEANGFVDASGDASLTYEAGLEVREPDAPVYGSLNFLIEGYDTETVKNLVIADVHARLAERGAQYGLVRHDGFLMHFPGKNIMLANVTHFETPLDPLGNARMVFEGRRQADNVIRFLRAEFPDIFRNAQVRVYGNPGLRQTRWIVGRRQLTLDEIRSGSRPADAAARCAWWVELHNARESGALGEIRAGSRLLHPAVVHDPQGRRQHRRRRPMRRCGRERVVRHSRHGPVHRHGRRRRACTRPGWNERRTRDRSRRAATATGRKPGSK